MVVYHQLDVSEDFRVATVSFFAGRGEGFRRGRGCGRVIEEAVGLRVEDEGNCKEAFDPFYELISSMRFEGI